MEPIICRTVNLPGLRPFSINSWFYARAKIITQDAHDWLDKVFISLNTDENQISLADIRAVFDPNKHVFCVNLSATYPPDVFFTKAGQVSARTIDTTNWEKPLIDCIFLKKYHVEPVPRGAPNLNTDDRYITEMRSSKRIGNEHSLQVEISVCPKPSL